MGIDAYLLLERKPGVSRAAILDALDRDVEDVTWHADQSFSFFTGVRFYEWEQSDAERRVRLTFAHLSPELFALVEPYALAWPDVADYDGGVKAADVEAGGAVRVDFGDYALDDPRLKRAADAEHARSMSFIEAMNVFITYQRAHPEFQAALQSLAMANDVAGLIARTRAVPELAGVVDTLDQSRFFQTYASSAQSSTP